MLTKAQIKLIQSLETKKHRTATGLFVAEGHKLVAEIVKSHFRIQSIFATKEWLSRGIGNKWLSDYNQMPIADEIIESTEEEIQRASLQKSPQQVIALVKIPEHNINSNEVGNQLSILLDNIQDPGNLGTIIRTADWFGIQNVFCSPETVDVYNPKVVQATMGSITRVKVHYTDLLELIHIFQDYKSFKTFGTFLDGDSIYDAHLSKKGFIVMGNEGRGISSELAKSIPQKLLIPSWQKEVKGPESLNVATATAIICSEFLRR